MKEHIVFIIVSILGLLGFYPLQSQASSLSKESFFLQTQLIIREFGGGGYVVRLRKKQ